MISSLNLSAIKHFAAQWAYSVMKASSFVCPPVLSIFDICYMTIFTRLFSFRFFIKLSQLSATMKAWASSIVCPPVLSVSLSDKKRYWNDSHWSVKKIDILGPGTWGDAGNSLRFWRFLHDNFYQTLFFPSDFSLAGRSWDWGYCPYTRIQLTEVIKGKNRLLEIESFIIEILVGNLYLPLM